MKMFRATNTGFQLAMIIGFVVVLIFAWWLDYFLIGLICVIPTLLISMAIESYYFIENGTLYRKDQSSGTFKQIQKSGGWLNRHILKLSEIERIKVSPKFFGSNKLSLSLIHI